jgi:putative ABC transport system permease protein
MFKNYIIVALRTLKRHKVYSLINIFGLAVGLALCLIVIGHISYELSFETQFRGFSRK